MIFSKLFKTVEEVDAKIKEYFESEKAKIDAELEIAKRKAAMDLQQLKLDLREQTQEAEKTLAAIKTKIDVLGSQEVSSLAAEKDKVITSLQQTLLNLSSRLGNFK
jgi:predicted  nucleic acid-binding Zn-ribbon protein